MTTNNESPWLTIEEAAEYLRCGLRYLREKVANKKIPHTKFGGKALFNKQRLDEWLLSLEEVPKADNQKANDGELETETFSTEILSDCNYEKVNTLVQKLIDFNEHFVTRLGNNLANDLKKHDFQKLSLKVYAQLSRWCHPNRNTERERKVLPIAHEISRHLFGHVISRTKHPSYGS